MSLAQDGTRPQRAMSRCRSRVPSSRRSATIGTSWVGATFQLGGGGLPSTSLASKWLSRSPVAFDITYLPHMKPFCPPGPPLPGGRANKDQLLALLQECVKVLACVVVGRALCFDVYVAAVGIHDGAGKCRRMFLFGISTVPNNGLCQEHGQNSPRARSSSRSDRKHAPAFDRRRICGNKGRTRCFRRDERSDISGHITTDTRTSYNSLDTRSFGASLMTVTCLRSPAVFPRAPGALPLFASGPYSVRYTTRFQQRAEPHRAPGRQRSATTQPEQCAR
jgi:hypothetical protein